ncbi:hypothetical protein DAPPPG215_28175 [Pseudomonas syringae pv. tomato]|uniref:DUF1534 domain-containing protein n=1 Tax=Pseudomonas syringae pv. tomato TaxID=323 RepID=A0AAV1BTP0_PSEUB|nr:hypothetical protein DAPPPG215_28175 [Pseudomonas syringae pv. tomato]
MSANCREPAAKQVSTVHPVKSRWPVLGPLRNPSRTSPLPRPPGRSALCVRTGRSFACPGFLAFCRNGLVRELPGTGSKTGKHGAPGKIKVACFWAASQPFADKSARPPGRSALCVRTGRSFACPGFLAFCRSGLVRDLPGTGSKTGKHGAPGKIKVACFWAASQPLADKSARPPGRSLVFGDLRSCV